MHKFNQNQLPEIFKNYFTEIKRLHSSPTRL